jgi:hypothetical protein
MRNHNVKLLGDPPWPCHACLGAALDWESMGDRVEIELEIGSHLGAPVGAVVPAGMHCERDGDTVIMKRLRKPRRVVAQRVGVAHVESHTQLA